MNSLRKTITSLYGKSGKEWLTNLPHLITQLSEKWDLDILEPYDHLSYHYVVRTRLKKNNQLAVLKIGFDHETTQQEIAALSFYQGNGCVKLLAYENNVCALLLEQANPGIPLSKLFPLRDSQAVAATYTLIQRLHAYSLPCADHAQFPHIKDIVNALNTTYGPSIPLLLLQKARFLAAQLMESATQTVLLHGDLHQDNIVSNEKTEWIAIDPQGIIGEPAYEMGAFLYNPLNQLADHPDAATFIENRIIQFSELSNISTTRIAQWAFVRAILCACWNIEDQLSPEKFVHCARLIEPFV